MTKVSNLNSMPLIETIPVVQTYRVQICIIVAIELEMDLLHFTKHACYLVGKVVRMKIKATMIRG